MLKFKVAAGWEVPTKERTGLEQNWRNQGIEQASMKKYQRLLKEQNGTCALCTRNPIKKRLALDHNHETGRIRGLLCQRCNFVLGILESWLSWGPVDIDDVINYKGREVPHLPEDELPEGPHPYVQEKHAAIKKRVCELWDPLKYGSLKECMEEVGKEFKLSSRSVRRIVGSLYKSGQIPYR